jgi:thioredoxin-like negative regulator of GroEL
MLNRRILLSAALMAGCLAFTGAAMAAEKTPFNQAAFDAAKAARKPILVEVTAPWCPTCKAQKPILSELMTSPKFKKLMIFEVDFDSQKDALRALNVRQQSTLIAYKAGQEVDRSTGDTNRTSIEALLNKAI